MSSTTEKIKDRMSIVDVVSQYVKLQKAGKNYKGISPFTTEKTPSFFVSAERGLYHCFSTGKGGDIFTFVQEMEGVDFQGALKVLAEQAGVEIKQESKGARDRRERLHKLLHDATAYFRKNLEGNKDALKYLEKRGLEQTTIESWNLGFAADAWGEARKHFIERGYGEKDLLEVGLIKKREGKDGTYDVFRNRIMFPISDSAGRVVGFSGRIVPSEKDEQGPKYLNSPDTELFSKSHVLYGYDKAKNAIRKNNFSLLVEGQLDVLLSHQVGYTNAVAVSGTALTEYHVRLLKRLSKNVLMAFDSDRAGIASSGRSADIALREGMDVKIAALPEGKDPADLIVEDADAWKRVVRESKHIIDFYLDIILQSESDPRKQQHSVRELVLPFVSGIRHAMERAHFVRIVAERLRVPEETVWVELKSGDNRGTVSSNQVNIEEQKRPQTSTTRDRRDSLRRELIGVYLWQKELQQPHIDTKELETKLRDLFGGELFLKVEALSEEQKHKLIFISEIAFETTDRLAEDIEELMHDYALEHARQELKEITQELKLAEAEGNTKHAEELLEKSNQLSQQLRYYANKENNKS